MLKVLHSPAAGAAAPPEPAPAEVATATAPPAGMLASLLKPENTGVGRQDTQVNADQEPDARWEHSVQLRELSIDKPVLLWCERHLECYIEKQFHFYTIFFFFFSVNRVAHYKRQH